MTFVFLLGVPFAVVGFVLCWLIPETPLRDQAYLSVGTEESPSERPLVPEEAAALPASQTV